MGSITSARDCIESTAAEGRNQHGTDQLFPAPNPPRVLHILAELRPSGAEVMLRIAAPFWFTSPGTQSILATGRTEGSYADRLREAGFAVHHIPFAKTLTFFCAVFALIRSGDYDAVHIHNELAVVFYGIVAWLAGIRRIIYTIHNVYDFTGSLRVERIVMRMVLRFLGAIPVAPGMSVAKNEAKRFFNRALLISNWCDTAVFRPPSTSERKGAREQYGISDGQPVIVTLGNCNEFKNHPLVLHAMSLLQRGDDWLYLHAGAEDRDESERALAERLGISEHCKFLGAVHSPLSVLWAADVFVMPSSREGFSIAAIEAVACGAPLVFSDAPGLRDLKGMIPDGFWVELKPQTLADAIEAARSQYPSGSPANTLTAQKLFSPETGAKAYLELYRGARTPLATQIPISR
jgi:glycosyltransferase involved in cell wall biosynthesis